MRSSCSKPRTSGIRSTLTRVIPRTTGRQIRLAVSPGSYCAKNSGLMCSTFRSPTQFFVFRAEGAKFPVVAGQLRECSARLERQIAAFSPSVVVPVGAKALAATRLIADHGCRNMKEAVAQRISWAGRWLFPVYHPSLLGRHPERGGPKWLSRRLAGAPSVLGRTRRSYPSTSGLTPQCGQWMPGVVPVAERSTAGGTPLGRNQVDSAPRGPLAGVAVFQE